LTEFLALFLAAALSVLTHELGHAFFQKLFGVPVTTIRWGMGPVLFRIGVLEVRGLLLGGAVTPAGPKLTTSRWKGVVIALGGIIAQWFAVWILAATKLYAVPMTQVFCQAFMFFSFLALTQLIPLKHWDGYYALQSLLGKYKRQNFSTDLPTI
jgi:membrane-associated protease RseP (regulator of RpoE activity)